MQVRRFGLRGFDSGERHGAERRAETGTEAGTETGAETGAERSEGIGARTGT